MKSIFQNTKKLFRQGTSPKALALSTVLGVWFGLFPVLGITTWFIPLLALRLRLNVALMLALSYLAWPVQVLLIVPFLRIGEWIWEMPAFPLSLEKMEVAFKTSFFTALNDFGLANLCAASGWLIVGAPVATMGYFLLAMIFEKTIGSRENAPASC